MAIQCDAPPTATGATASSAVCGADPCASALTGTASFLEEHVLSCATMLVVVS